MQYTKDEGVVFPMARPKKYVIRLTEDEVKKLKSQMRKKATSVTVVKRCQVLLELDDNNPKHLTHEQIAKVCAVSTATVSNIVTDYVNGGINKIITLERNPNSNAHRKVDGRAEARLIELACGPVPEGYSRWTLRLLEEKSRIILDEPVGKDAIHRALKKTNLSLI